MWWPFQWLVIYVLGGLTFVPLVIILTIAYVWNYGSVPVGDTDLDKPVKAVLQEEAERDEQLEKDKAASASATKPLSGWLTVRRHFKPAISGAAGLFTANSPVSPTYPEAHAENAEDSPVVVANEDNASIGSTSTTNGVNPATSAPTTYSARIAQTYRSMVEARSKREPVPKEFFFCVLKGSVLFLYEDEDQSECVAAITIDKFVVEIEGKEGKRFRGKDAEMFAKRNAIVLRRAESGGAKKGLPVLAKGMSGDDPAEKELENKPWFFFSKSNTKMEDWYIALLQASSQSPTTSEVFSFSDMQTLVDTIDTEPDPIPMRWFNAMIGRIFFALYRTEALEQFIITKIMKKLSRVPRPSFLGPIVVREVNVGTSPPFFSKPMLKDLSADGTAAFEVHMQYRARPRQPDSEVRITIATTATIPTGFKPYVVNLVLAVVLKSLEGNMILQIKKPPSNRLWYGFTQMPKMEVEIVPIVSERKIQIGMVLKAMEKQLRDVIAESIVLPNMDDIAFFDTSKLKIRGGIFSEATKLKRDVAEEKKEETIAEPIQLVPDIAGSAEDPTSAVPVTTNLRKRPTKSQTVDVNGLDLHVPDEPNVGLARTETAPVGSSTTSGATTKKAVALQATKKWFAQAGAAKPPSLTSQTVTGGSNNTSQDDLLNRRSLSSDRNPSASTSAPSVETINLSNTPEVATVQVSASTPTLAEQSNGVKPIGQSSLPLSQTDVHPTGSGLRHSEASSIAPNNTDASIDPRASHASLIASLRTRDKKAIQSQVNTAKDAMKTWGSTWAAKRKAGFGRSSMDEHSERPTALYRPPDVDERGDDVVAPSSPGRSLQERLNAAAHVGAISTPPMPIPARERSSSTASKPSLLSSPKSSASPASASPPKWTPSTSKATTEIAKDEASAGRGRSSMDITRNVTSQTRRTSASTPPISSQPAPGRSMVVPRVPKRPGEVKGIGSNPGQQGLVRRISTEDGLVEEKVEDVEHDKPGLPTRPLQEIASAPHEGLSDISSPAIGPGISIPPPLPPRKTPTSSRSPSPRSSGEATPNVTKEPVNGESSVSPPESGEPLERAESAPTRPASPPRTQPTSLPTTENKTASPPRINTYLPGVDAVSSHSVKEGKTSTPRRAEDALRQVVQRDEGMRAKRQDSKLGADADKASVSGQEQVEGIAADEDGNEQNMNGQGQDEGNHGAIPGHLIGA